jgi:cell division septum initiation protein DivIVA
MSTDIERMAPWELRAEVERLREENAQLSQDLADLRRSAKTTFGRWLEAKATIQQARDLAEKMICTSSGRRRILAILDAALDGET